MAEYDFLCRVLKIQTHKYSNFIYVAGFKKAHQLLIDDKLMEQYNIGIMSVIKGSCSEVENNAGKLIYKIVSIESHTRATDCNSYRDNYTNKAMTFKQCRNAVMAKVQDFLKSEQFQPLNSPFTIPYRGTSTAQPLRICGKYVDRFCKITHEFSIKKVMSELLCPVYEIGYVARDVYSTTTNWFEYNILEFVSPLHGLDFIEKFIRAFIDIASTVADEYGIKHYDFSSLKIIPLDNNNEYKGQSYEELKKVERNVIFLNAPIESPLVKCIDGRRSETIWFFNGDSMGHGYYDENDYTILYNYSLGQRIQLLAKGIKAEMSEDFLELLKLGMPDSISLGFGVDRFFQQFFLFPNFKDYHKYMD